MIIKKHSQLLHDILPRFIQYRARLQVTVGRTLSDVMLRRELKYKLVRALLPDTNRTSVALLHSMKCMSYFNDRWDPTC